MSRTVVLLVVQVALCACEQPAQRIDAIADAYEFSRSIVQGTKFEHVVYANGVLQRDVPLHVYLEGDGTPFLSGDFHSSDPTPRVAVMLDLMALDPGPAVYLGRPCYFGLANRPPCKTEDWTQRRFSPEVVESMTTALGKIVGESGSSRLELFGHSGGGTLAVLLARRVKGVTRVVTLAGNLDHRKWCKLHGYAPLDGSLNPVDEGPLPESIVQLHVAGAKDRNVPPGLIETAAVQLGANEVLILPDVTHACCWATHWPDVLDRR